MTQPSNDNNNLNSLPRKESCRKCDRFRKTFVANSIEIRCTFCGSLIRVFKAFISKVV